MNKSSLHRQLVLPYVLLVIFVSITIGWVSYHAGEKAVTSLSQRVLMDMVERIANATEHHLAGALVALNSVDPDPKTVPKTQPFSIDLNLLETRLWIASGLFMDLSNYVYFGGEDGRFVGVNRVNKDFVELYLREPGAKRRQIYTVSAPGDRSRLLRSDGYDPRTRPWYETASRQKRPVWSAVYNDFTSREPTITLAKPVRRADNRPAGVLATDVTLKTMTDFLRTLKVSDNGIAFVMDGGGFMVATSGSELPFKMVKGVPERMHIDEMQTPLIREAYAKVIEWKKQKEGDKTSLLNEFLVPSGTIEIAASELGRKYGIDWTADAITWYVDGRAIGTVRRSDLPAADQWEFGKPHVPLLNLAVGGSWPGAPDASTPFPAVLSVASVKLYDHR